MEVISSRCCGLDIHKKTVVACLISGAPRQPPQIEIRTFRTMTAELLLLADWLQASGCTHVAMESTGVYWRPVYNLLEGLFTLLVVNAQHIKNQADLPGCPVQTYCGPAGKEARPHCPRTYHSRDRVYIIDPEAAVSGSGHGLL